MLVYKHQLFNFAISVGEVIAAD